MVNGMCTYGVIMCFGCRHLCLLVIIKISKKRKCKKQKEMQEKYQIISKLGVDWFFPGEELLNIKNWLKFFVDLKNF